MDYPVVSKRRQLASRAIDNAKHGRAKRKETDEEIMHTCKLALGTITISLQPRIYLPGKRHSRFVPMRGQNITFREIKTAGQVRAIIDAIHVSGKNMEKWMEFVKELEGKK